MDFPKQNIYQGHERRAFPRVLIKHPIMIRSKGQVEFIPANCINISQRGILIFSVHYDKPGNSLEVKIMAAKEKSHLVLSSKIIWTDEGISETDPSEKQYLIAAEFYGLTDDIKKKLIKLLN